MDNKDTKEKIAQHVRVPHKMRNNKKIDYLAQGFYPILKKYMNGETKQCYPSLQTLANDSGLSIPTIRKYLKILEEEGHIKISKKLNKSGTANKDIKKAPNVYTFNEDSELYKNGFEMFSYDFLNKNIKFREKAACIALQEEMYKNGNTGAISSTSLEMSNKLDVSYNTFKSIEKNLKNENILVTTKSNAKDMVTGEFKTQYLFNLEVLGQAVLYNQIKIKEHDNKIKEHDNKIKEHDTQMQEFKEKIEMLEKENKFLRKELNSKQVSEISKPLNLEIC